MYTAFISQFPPSESSKIRQVAGNAILFNFLKSRLGIGAVKDVWWHEESGAAQFVTISITKTSPTQPWQVLKGADALNPSEGKMIIVVDVDIDPRTPIQSSGPCATGCSLNGTSSLRRGRQQSSIPRPRRRAQNSCPIIQPVISPHHPF